MATRARVVALLVVGSLAAADDVPVLRPNATVLYDVTDEEYYSMPELFHLDSYDACLSRRGVYCVGTFELSAPPDHPTFRLMTEWSNNWVDHMNHTKLHRGLCVSRRCPAPPAPPAPHMEHWFERCVDEHMASNYNMSARLAQLEYCRRGPAERVPLTPSQRAFAAALAAILALAAISTTLDITLTDHTKKGVEWALSWSLIRSWRALTAPAARGSPGAPDLRTFDGLRVFCMMAVILEHVCWLTTLSYLANTRYLERQRRAPDAMLMTNGTLVVQIFFLMASFLLAHKILKQRQKESVVKTFFSTMANRIVRISPSNFLVVWFAASWWERLGDGPLWAPLVGGEAAVCRRKWWTHALYLNNLIMPDDKCLIQTWYLAADMQLYVVGLALTLLVRGRRAVPVLAALFVLVTGLNLALSFHWRLVPNFVLHRVESIRLSYAGDASFNVLYQSPLGNAPAALGGLLLAHLYHRLRAAPVHLAEIRWFRWVSVMGAPLAVWWAAAAPLLASGAAPGLGAAALAALERPAFVLLVFIALLGAINGIKSPWRTWLSHLGAVLPRLSYGALLLHLPLNKMLIGSRVSPVQLDRSYVYFEWFGVASLSYAAAVPLALLVELPAQELYRALTAPRHPAQAQPDPTREKLDKNDT